MSKIAEQKALEEYPIKIEKIYYGLPLINGAEPFTDDANIQLRNAYVQGYDQAFQDFLEKAEKILTERMYFSDDEAKEFKNYMQDEI